MSLGDVKEVNPAQVISASSRTVIIHVRFIYIRGSPGRDACDFPLARLFETATLLSTFSQLCVIESRTLRKADLKHRLLSLGAIDTEIRSGRDVYENSRENRGPARSLESAKTLEKLVYLACFSLVFDFSLLAYSPCLTLSGLVGLRGCSEFVSFCAC